MTGADVVFDHEALFWAKVDKTDSCWLWLGLLSNSGYGRVTIRRRGFSVHRVSYEWIVGPIPPGLQIDHLCRVRNCVNPAHLEAVTPQENLRRAWIANGTGIAVTSCPVGHVYTAENTYVQPGTNNRSCITCRRAKGRAYQRANAERLNERRRLKRAS